MKIALVQFRIALTLVITLATFAATASAQSFVDEFLDDFDDGNLVQWGEFRTELGTVSVSDGVANFKSITGSTDTSTAVRNVFLPSGPLEPNDIVNIRTEVIGSTIVHSAWLEGMDISTGATVTWTDRQNRYPTGDLVAISFQANGNSTAEVNILSYGITIVPEPTGSSLLMCSLTFLPFLLRSGRMSATAS
jgi:hypothetical protein